MHFSRTVPLPWGLLCHWYWGSQVEDRTQEVLYQSTMTITKTGCRETAESEDITRRARTVMRIPKHGMHGKRISGISRPGPT